MIPDQLHSPTDGNDVPTEFVVPGLPFLSKTIFPGSSGSGAETHRAEKLGKDLALYERKATEFVDKMKAEALSRDVAQLAVADPLNFWLSQVLYNLPTFFGDTLL